MAAADDAGPEAGQTAGNSAAGGSSAAQPSSAATSRQDAPLARLLKRADFLRAAGAGRKCALPGMVLQAYARKDGLPRPGDRSQAARALAPDAIRFGLTVSKKVGNAVERNRVRRRLRALAKETLPRLGEQGTDYVLIGRAASLERSFPDLRRDLEKALQRVCPAGDGPAGASGGARHGAAKGAGGRGRRKGGSRPPKPSQGTVGREAGRNASGRPDRHESARDANGREASGRNASARDDSGRNDSDG